MIGIIDFQPAGVHFTALPRTACFQVSPGRRQKVA